jgi:hypothetical protein
MSLMIYNIEKAFVIGARFGSYTTTATDGLCRLVGNIGLAINILINININLDGNININLINQYLAINIT